MTESRIRTAIQFMKEKKPFLVDDLRLGVNEIGVIEITGWSQLKNFGKLTKHRVLEELNEVKLLFFKMVSTSNELRNFIEGKRIKFNLWYDDFGKASIGICSEENGIIHWDATIKD